MDELEKQHYLGYEEGGNVNDPAKKSRKWPNHGESALERKRGHSWRKNAFRLFQRSIRNRLLVSDITRTMDNRKTKRQRHCWNPRTKR